MIIDDCYPGHMMVLTKGGLNMKTFRILKLLWENSDEWEKQTKKKKVNSGGKRNAFNVSDSHKYSGRKSIVSL